MKKFQMEMTMQAIGRISDYKDGFVLEGLNGNCKPVKVEVTGLDWQELADIADCYGQRAKLTVDFDSPEK